MGLIEYNGCIHVHKSLLNVVLHDQRPGANTISVALPESKRDKTNKPRRATVSATNGESPI